MLINLLKALKSPAIFFSSIFFSFFNQYFPSLSEQRNHFYLSQFGDATREKYEELSFCYQQIFEANFCAHFPVSDPKCPQRHPLRLHLWLLICTSDGLRVFQLLLKWRRTPLLFNGYDSTYGQFCIGSDKFSHCGLPGLRMLASKLP